MIASAPASSWFGFILVLGLYFMPTLVAKHRDHYNIKSIFVLNLLLGWTVIGWIVALVMAFSNPPPPTTVIYQNGPPPPTGPAANG